MIDPLKPLIRTLTFAVFAIVCLPVAVSAAIINVSNSTQLNSALTTVNPGDEIVMANGTYSGFTITRSGTASAPIKIRAANRLQATLNSGIIRFNNNVAYVTVEGLNITTAGASNTIDGETRKTAVWFQAAKNCRLTRCKLQLSGHTGSTEWIMLSGNSQFNRIDHCEFGPNSVDGHLIWPRGSAQGITYDPVADRGPWANGQGPFNPNMARNTLVDHNYFHDHLVNVSNGGELMVFGAFGMPGDYQDTYTIVEYNLINNCWGDGELFSIKTSSTTIRFNTMTSCGGGPTSRSGNKNHIYGNFMLQNNRNGSSGIRIHEMDHQVFNNYIENANGTAISVGDGDPYNQDGFSHAQVVRGKIFNNTFVGCGPVDTGNAHPLDPVNLVIANNILLNTTETISDPPLAGWTYSQNIIWPSTGPSGFLNINPLLTTQSGLQKLSASSPAINAANASLYPWLTDDMDGHLRNDPDIGADEFNTGGILRRPLTTADVGPNSPEGTVTTWWEAERLTFTTNNPTATLVLDDNASGVFWVSVNATAVGQFKEFNLPNVPPGTYTLQLEYKGQANRGTLSVSVDGAALPGTLDQYNPTTAYLEATLGVVTFSQHGSHIVRLTVTGQNPSSTAFTLSADKFLLVPGSLPQVAAPVFNPPPGTFTSPISVEITCSTPDAIIRYTTDGSNPSPTTGTVYAGPVPINTTTTLKAMAFKSGMTDSPITSGVYVINLPDTAPPVFNPPAGTYTSPQSVTITSATPGATIRYTTNGLTPSQSVGIIYTGPVPINVTTTLRAIAFASGFDDSTVTVGTYTINLPQAAAPVFSPPAGTYTNAQSVTITSTTGGASIRYTTNGVNPTSTTGTLYTGPVPISVTTTLKAIAFASGFSDSPVTTGLYTINTGGGEICFEAETAPITVSGATSALQTDANASAGQWMLLSSDGVGDWIQFTTPNIPAGTYSVKLAYKKNNNRAIISLQVDGVQIGGTLDQYASPSVFTEQVFGTVTFATAGTHVIRLTAVGKNAASGSFTISADEFCFTPTTAPPPTVLMEAELLPRTSSGATTSTANDAAASGGVWLALNATNAGPFMDLTTSNLVAGTYSVQFTYKSNNTRGQHTVLIDGQQVGGTIDQYTAVQGFVTVTLGNITFGSAGTHTIRMTVTGKNASSSNFILSADKFTFVGQ